MTEKKKNLRKQTYKRELTKRSMQRRGVRGRRFAEGELSRKMRRREDLPEGR